MSFPADYLAQLRALEDAYLASDDPIRQSGFGGGPERWRAEREPILDAIDGDGDLLDIGCANGYLLECLVAWGAERGLRITPHGLDLGERLVAEARRRMPEFAANFHAGNAWDWQPERRYRYVYTLHDCVPPELLGEYVRRLLERVVEPRGRLIVGAYGSRSRGTPPLPVAEVLESFGLRVTGRAMGGDPPITEFAWVDR
jgi:SAM-dependent methyltransferase